MIHSPCVPIRFLPSPEQSPEEFPDIEEDQGGDAVGPKIRVLGFPDRTLSPHLEEPPALFIFVAVSTTLDVGGFSQSLRSVEADDLNYTMRTVGESRTASAGTGNSRQGAIVITLSAIAAQRRRGRAGVAVHRACHAGANELRHGGNGRRHRRRDCA